MDVETGTGTGIIKTSTGMYNRQGRPGRPTTNPSQIPDTHTHTHTHTYTNKEKKNHHEFVINWEREIKRDH